VGSSNWLLTDEGIGKISWFWTIQLLFNGAVPEVESARKSDFPVGDALKEAPGLDK
jgi:hypothetical protein